MSATSGIALRQSSCRPSSMPSPAGFVSRHDPLCRRITGNLQARELLGVPPGENAWVSPEDQDAALVPHFRLYRHGQRNAREPKCR